MVGTMAEESDNGVELIVIGKKNNIRSLLSAICYNNMKMLRTNGGSLVSKKKSLRTTRSSLCVWSGDLEIERVWCHIRCRMSLLRQTSLIIKLKFFVNKCKNNTHFIRILTCIISFSLCILLKKKTLSINFYAVMACIGKVQFTKNDDT